MMNNKYAVLMSVYAKEKPNYLKLSILSMLNQTIPPSEFVIVCDGPLHEDLDTVINSFSEIPIFKIIRLEKNFGLSHALKIGLEQCESDYVLRMDSDDISRKDRADKELKLLNLGFDVVGGYISEFTDCQENIIGYREVPLNEKDIRKFSKKRNPFNHPSVAFKKSLIIEAGNYSDETRYMQDYFLWIKCLQIGAKCVNIPEVLVDMRSGQSMRTRRSGKEYIKSYKTIFKYMLKTKYISFFRYFFNCVSYFFFSHIKGNFKEKITYKFLRKKRIE